MSYSILFTYHSSSLFSKDIIDYLNGKKINVFPLTETTPSELSLRAQLIKTCDCVIVLASRDFQKSNSCMETIHFAKDLRKEIYGISTSSNYKPFGALGAILCGSEHVVYKIYALDNLKKEIDLLATEIHNKIKPLNSSTLTNTQFSQPLNPSTNLVFIETSNCADADVLISYHSKTKNITELIEKALTNKKITYKTEDSSLETSSIKRVKVLVIIMSAEYEENFNCRMVVQKAIELNLKIIPISISKAWKPTDWLGLLIAGKIFYRIFDKEQAFKVKYDSTPMNDLIFAIIGNFLKII